MANHATNFNHNTHVRTTSQDILHSIFHENKKQNQIKVISSTLCDGADVVICVFVYHIPTNTVIQTGYFNPDGTAWGGTVSSLGAC